MRKINPEYISLVSKATNASSYFKLLNMRLIDFDIGSSKIEIDVDPLNRGSKKVKNLVVLDKSI